MSAYFIFECWSHCLNFSAWTAKIQLLNKELSTVLAKMSWHGKHLQNVTKNLSLNCITFTFHKAHVGKKAKCGEKTCMQKGSPQKRENTASFYYHHIYVLGII